MTNNVNPLRHAGGIARAKLWGAAPGARRGPKPKLTLEAIVNAALGVARKEGLESVSMAGVAEAVGCSKMALYRHVSSRDDLLAAMLDTALGEPPRLNGGWHERFTTLWEGLLALYSQDPWILDLPADIDTLTPQNAAWIDVGLSLFETSTLPYGDRFGAVLLITENARFLARLQRSEGRPTDDLDHLLSSAAHARDLLPSERYPHLFSLIDHDQADPPSSPIALTRDMMVSAIGAYFQSEAP